MLILRTTLEPSDEYPPNDACGPATLRSKSAFSVLKKTTEVELVVS